jgi:hypothetical protein
VCGPGRRERSGRRPRPAGRSARRLEHSHPGAPQRHSQISTSWVSRWVSTPTTASTTSANMGTGLVSFPGRRVTSAPAWMGSPSGTSVTGHAPRGGQASDQANQWARPVPATAADKSRPRHAKAARSQYGSHRAAGPKPGALPPRSTATTLTDPIEADSAACCRSPRSWDHPERISATSMGPPGCQ